VANTDKKTADKAATSKMPSGRTSSTPPPEEHSLRPVWLAVIAALAAVAVAAGIVYWRGGFDQAGPGGPKKDPDVAELMAPGPLPDIAIGKADAPITIVEYASMTCPHCAQFHTAVLPQLKTKYLDSGQAKLILREFPLDGLAVAAFMLARCAGPDRYYPMVGALFETQGTWAVPGTEGKDKLLLIARQAGFSKEKFDQCLADKDLFNKIVAVRQQANDKFQVDSTPSFFVNGKRMTGDHQLKDFDAALAAAGAPAAKATPAQGAATPPAGAEAPSAPAEGNATSPQADTSKPEGTPAQPEGTPAQPEGTPAQ
jgi:protein-disulfide isomerase